jgi:flagellar biosynthesis/type III secretory pathway M-ring protein FliF/YscJ
LAQLGILAVIVLALIFFVLRPMVSRRPTPNMSELTGIASFDRPMAAIGQDRGGSDPSGNDGILDLPPQTLSKIDRLRDVISSRSDDSAAVLKSWIEAPEPRKEIASS